MTDTQARVFDASDAEVALQDHIEKILGGGVEIFDSNVTGVIAFERLGGADFGKVDWDALARDLSDATGFKVLNVSNCDWSFNDRCDEEATYVAFDVPGLDREYLTPERNLLSADYMAEVDPEFSPAPSM